MGRKIKTEKMQEILIRTSGSVNKVAEILGIPTSTVWRRFRSVHNCSPGEWYQQYLERKEVKLLLNTDKLISELQDRGYFVEKEAQSSDYEFTPKIKAFDGDIFELGLVSDTHLCSKYQQLTHLHTFYEMMSRRGITTILHCGDISDGENVYKGHVYELFQHGANEQIEYVARHYPEYSGINTYYICGNHDESFYKRSGIDLGKYLSYQRKDLIHLGFHGAYFNVRYTKKLIYMHHGAGGVAYARSYKQQKIVEQFTPSQKPYIHLLGHYHTMNTLWSYRNVFSQMLPCFQTQTPYLKRKGLNPEVGGMILNFRIVDGKPTTPKVEFIPFYVHKEKDF